MATLSPIFSLPTSLLEDTFDLYIWDDWMHLVKPEHENDAGGDYPVCILALVCRTWHATVNGCPKLWSRIDLTRQSRAPFYFDKARGVPLHVAWVQLPGHQLTETLPTQLLRPPAPLVESLEIIHNCESILALRDIQFPNLKKLVFGDRGSTRQGGLGHWFPATLPALQELVLM